MYVNKRDVTEWQAILSIRNVTCSRGGDYTCRVNNSDGKVHNKSTSLSVRRLPSAPTLSIYPIVETLTINNPNCSAGNLGYYPAMTFVWTLTEENGIETNFSPTQITSVKSSNTQTCTTSGSSVLDAQRYSGGSWNNSLLCCKLTDPTTGQVVKADCKKVYTLPANYCTGYNDDFRYYPYEPCNTYVQCHDNYVYFNYCNDLFCINPVTKRCDIPKTS
ncbi:hypothetical protein C0Q70_20999 [Pomacea canaliculata]|uniref:Chitin-binding type-2 domain-containing protein n=1 Tax=Pomacea canaliculata TaxID=400727 RepID=A0A2T7NB99_POMCA|nr:hypothetical protein C0Q70_20999 [Pomacea canaliculata]